MCSVMLLTLGARHVGVLNESDVAARRPGSLGRRGRQRSGRFAHAGIGPWAAGPLVLAGCRVPVGGRVRVPEWVPSRALGRAAGGQAG
jgi:hypothetical protein